MSESNITHAPFKREHLGSMADEIKAVIYTYVDRVSVAEVIGVLEIVKHEIYNASESQL